jgi:hypothetical protein
LNQFTAFSHIFVGGATDNNLFDQNTYATGDGIINFFMIPLFEDCRVVPPTLPPTMFPLPVNNTFIGGYIQSGKTEFVAINLGQQTIGYQDYHNNVLPQDRHDQAKAAADEWKQVLSDLRELWRKAYQTNP